MTSGNGAVGFRSRFIAGETLVGTFIKTPATHPIEILGRIGFDAAWRLLAAQGIVMRPKPAFGHALAYRPPRGPVVIASYHPSRQNTNTGKLTAPMFQAVFDLARRELI